MVFFCAPKSRAALAAKKQALAQRVTGIGAHAGVSLRLLLVDRQVSPRGHLAAAALATVHVVNYDSAVHTLDDLVGKIRQAHLQNGAPFLSVACANHGADDAGRWAWASDLSVELSVFHGALDQLAPLIASLGAALSKAGGLVETPHIDFLACGLTTASKVLVPALEKMYGVDFRASTDATGNDLNGGDWKMETDNDYDVAADYLCAAQTQGLHAHDGEMQRVRQKHGLRVHQ